MAQFSGDINVVDRHGQLKRSIVTARLQRLHRTGIYVSYIMVFKCAVTCSSVVPTLLKYKCRYVLRSVASNVYDSATAVPRITFSSERRLPLTSIHSFAFCFAVALSLTGVGALVEALSIPVCCGVDGALGVGVTVNDVVS